VAIEQIKRPSFYGHPTPEVQAPRPVIRRGGVDQRREEIYKFIAGCKFLVGYQDIMDETGYTRHTVRNMCQQLEDAGRIRKASVVGHMTYMEAV
jgi:DNA invertase Pin-like site-specific DNA recombinase